MKNRREGESSSDHARPFPKLWIEKNSAVFFKETSKKSVQVFGRICAIYGGRKSRALAIADCEMLSLPLACFEKWDTVKTTSLASTAWNLKPSSLTCEITLLHSSLTCASVVDTDAKCEFRASSSMPCNSLRCWGSKPRLRNSRH